MKYTLLILLLLSFYLRSAAQAIPSNAHMARENEYHAGFYFLDLTIQDTSASISGNVMMRGYPLAGPIDTFAVEMDTTLIMDSAVADLNGGAYQPTAIARSGIEVNILLPFTAGSGQYTEVRMYYHGKPKLSGPFPTSGFFGGADQRFSASPPYNAYTWHPCKQVLADKADSSWFFITTDTASIAASNGLLKGVTAISPTLNRYEWKSHHKIAFYLISFVVGRFTETTQYFHPAGAADSLPIQYYNYTPPFDSLIPTILQVYTDLFGPYPFYDEKFGIAEVNLSGGMENQTLVSLGVGGVEAHETAHQWFGDNVTCGSWQDVMVNEGFARWCESVYPEFSGGGDSARIVHCNGYEASVLANPHGSGYSPADTQTVIGVFGDEALYYDKNAMMLNSLRYLINNDSIFFLGLRNYQDMYRGGSGYGSILRDVMENTTGMDLTDFFNQLYYGFGYPTYNVQWNQVDSQLMLQINETASSPNTPLFTTPLQLQVQGMNGDTTIRLPIGDTITAYSMTIYGAGAVNTLVVDPGQWIANGHGTVQQNYNLYVSGIRDIKPAGNYSVYPNPASNNLMVSSASFQGPVDIAMYNQLGQVIYSATTTMPCHIPLPALPDGLYTLQVAHAEAFKVTISQ
jgi:hypothetical protein